MTAPHSPAIVWLKSSACVPGNCVEVAFGERAVFVRDSKNPSGPILKFSPDEWRDFLRLARTGKIIR